MSYTKIVDHLYLGSYTDIIKEYYKTCNTNAIINVAKECNYMLTDEDGDISYHHYLYDDRPGDQICEVFDEVADLMNEYISNHKNVFIHCYAGRSRSVSFVIVYLIKYCGFELQSAYNYVDKLRGIYPNLGFIQQLMDYEVTLLNNMSLDYDKICIDYICSTIGWASLDEVKDAYSKCNKDVDATMDTLFASR